MDDQAWAPGPQIDEEEFERRLSGLEELLDSNPKLPLSREQNEKLIIDYLFVRINWEAYTPAQRSEERGMRLLALHDQLSSLEEMGCLYLELGAETEYGMIMLQHAPLHLMENLDGETVMVDRLLQASGLPGKDDKQFDHLVGSLTEWADQEEHVPLPAGIAAPILFDYMIARTLWQVFDPDQRSLERWHNLRDLHGRLSELHDQGILSLYQVLETEQGEIVLSQPPREP